MKFVNAVFSLFLCLNTSVTPHNTPDSILSPAVAPEVSAYEIVEPAYCRLSEFLRYELEIPKKIKKGLKRNHAFQVGQVTLAGLAVGKSKLKSTQSLAALFSQGPLDSGSCTWYLHQKNQEARENLNWSPIIKNPKKMDEEEAAREFEIELESRFLANRGSGNNFISCLEQSKFLAIGCHGMCHRGPSAFAMILAFSGCTPDHSVAIVNQVWGLNGVKPEVRRAIAQRGYEMGERHWFERGRLQTLFSN